LITFLIKYDPIKSKKLNINIINQKIVKLGPLHDACNRLETQFRLINRNKYFLRIYILINISLWSINIKKCEKTCVIKNIGVQLIIKQINLKYSKGRSRRRLSKSFSIDFCN
jgi:hypothetical protein